VDVCEELTHKHMFYFYIMEYRDMVLSQELRAGLARVALTCERLSKRVDCSGSR
jgi:hypothetical protein